jgi:selenocysteine-specific elongation factor
VIVGTAGHIDHGKTSLVRALTGVDTDRLKEEKARGISLELGYAYWCSKQGTKLGFIDVPGHERLVHTMVAGACGIDAALLVIAADDGVMPQTREHLAILELTGVTRGAVALSKVDRVDPARIDEVRAQVSALLAPTCLRGIPVFCVQALQADNAGVLALRDYLEKTAAQLPQPREDRFFRLAVDRVFTLPGHGTIVAGTVFSGTVREQDTLEVMPRGAGSLARVRSLHAHNEPAPQARSGERCALNLTGVERRSIARGDWLAEPGVLRPTLRLDVRLKLRADCDRSFKNAGSLHVHLGTSDGLARVVLLDAASVSAGESVRAQLILEAPVCAQLGDRFILRNAQSTQTLGGGCVLDPCPPARRRHAPERLRYLDALERLHAQGQLDPLLEQAPGGVALGDIARLTGIRAEHLILPTQTLRLAAAHGAYVILPHYWARLREKVLATLREFHAQFPDEPGPDAVRLRRMAVAELSLPLWEVLVAELLQQQLLVRAGPCVQLPDYVPQLTLADQVLMAKLTPLIAAGRFDPPWTRDLAGKVHEPEERVRSVLRKAVTLGALYQVVRDLFYDAKCVAELARVAATLAGQDGSLNAARFRDSLGVGRKRAVQILEFFDRVGYTRRIRDLHVLRRESGWSDVWKAHVPGGAAGLQTQEGAPRASW